MTKRKIKNKHGKCILLIAKEDQILAYYNDSIIGEFDFDEIEINEWDSKKQLYSMNILPEYQRSGIGTEMILLALEEYGEFLLP